MDLDLGLFLDMLPQAVELGFERIAFTGGEFCMHPDHEAMVAATVEHGLKFSIVSNGSRVDSYKRLAERFNDRLYAITFSLDGPDAAIHDAIRGRGSFEAVLKAAETFKPLGTVTINHCLTKLNADGLEETVQLAGELGVEELRLIAAIPVDGSSDVFLLDADKEDCMAKLLAVAPKGVVGDAEVIPLTSLCSTGGIHFCDGLTDISPMISPNGNVRFCCDLVEGVGDVGSLMEQPLSALVEQAREVCKNLLGLREELLEAGMHAEGMNTCVFCNSILRQP